MYIYIYIYIYKATYYILPRLPAPFPKPATSPDCGRSTSPLALALRLALPLFTGPHRTPQWSDRSPKALTARAAPGQPGGEAFNSPQAHCSPLQHAPQLVHLHDPVGTFPLTNVLAALQFLQLLFLEKLSILHLGQYQSPGLLVAAALEPFDAAGALFQFAPLPMHPMAPLPV